MKRHVHIEADVHLTSGNDRIAIDATGSTVSFHFSNYGSLWKFLNEWIGRRNCTDYLRNLDKLSTGCGLSTHVTMRNRTIAVMGTGARPGLIATALNIDFVELRPLSILRGLIV